MSKNLVVFGKGNIADLAIWYFNSDTDYKVIAQCAHLDYINHEEDTDRGIVDLYTVPEIASPEEAEMFIAIGYSKLNSARRDIFLEAKEMGYTLASYVSSKASVLSEKPIGENCFILEDNTIQPFVEVGDNVTLWSGNHIGHHSKIGNHTFVSSHVVVSGNVNIGEQCFLGVNSTIRDGIELGDRTVVGAGSLVMKSAPPDSVFIPKPTLPSAFTSDRLGRI